MLNINYSNSQKCLHIATEYVFNFQQNSAQPARPCDRNTMIMQLTEQNCSRQPALVYTENLCKSGSNYSKKMFNMSSIVFLHLL